MLFGFQDSICCPSLFSSLSPSADTLALSWQDCSAAQSASSPKRQRSISSFLMVFLRFFFSDLAKSTVIILTFPFHFSPFCKIATKLNFSNKKSPQRSFFAYYDSIFTVISYICHKLPIIGRDFCEC